MNEIRNRLDALHRRIAAACRRSARPPEAVRLLAVSKTFGPDLLQIACAAGQAEFGESYVQEALPKQEALKERGFSPVWHFIGPLQSNKTRAVAEHFSWVHTVDRIKTAERLSSQRPAALPPLEVCVQVNISAETSKSGCAPQDAATLCAAVAALPRLRLRGLMAIPRPEEDPEAARPQFRALRELAGRIRTGGAVEAAAFDTLSMGMSGDFEVAVEEGATIVRIGSAVFGPRGLNSG